ncbi:helix-turn-helix transcriptional regulator [Bacillus cereus]|nr:helix-turn-helix transcriptional regulator [Bacillus cereus group sp. TH36-2LC]MDA1509631.1 helix-turn-helix transcriptional regulator [Bacillus cereus group sp. TH36-2LC]MDZ4632251.1 helix-turn-helix transcriptional regulator [Bacillus cereus]
MKNLERFPSFAVKCKLGEIMQDRGISTQELADLTGIRPATISELCNLKRTTVSIPHLTVIAMTLRIKDMNELLEFSMLPETEEIIEQDQQIIELHGSLLPEQDEYLSWLRYERKLIRKFWRIAKKKPTDN